MISFLILVAIIVIGELYTYFLETDQGLIEWLPLIGRLLCYILFYAVIMFFIIIIKEGMLINLIVKIFKNFFPF